MVGFLTPLSKKPLLTQDVTGGIPSDSPEQVAEIMRDLNLARPPLARLWHKSLRSPGSWRKKDSNAKSNQYSKWWVSLYWR